MDSYTGPEMFAASQRHLHEAREHMEPGSPEETSHLTFAKIHAINAQTAVLTMIAENMHDHTPYELDAWREVIPRPPLKECKNKESRRPACTDRHTEDCPYADPPPEPKHELLPVGMRVLVSDTATKHPDGRVEYARQPYAAKIVGYAANDTKYQLNHEKPGGGYYDFVMYAFADNRVQPHPEQDTAVAEPTGPRVYVQNHHGKQGHVVEFRQNEGRLRVLVQWYSMGARPVWHTHDNLTIIASEDVERCPSGQTRDECGSGENQCELCLADEDNEAEAIEGSMNV
jgi:hypothetical protein